jgi:hypothetical protein
MQGESRGPWCHVGSDSLAALGGYQQFRSDIVGTQSILGPDHEHARRRQECQTHDTLVAVGSAGSEAVVKGIWNRSKQIPKIDSRRGSVLPSSAPLMNESSREVCEMKSVFGRVRRIRERCGSVTSPAARRRRNAKARAAGSSIVVTMDSFIPTPEDRALDAMLCCAARRAGLGRSVDCLLGVISPLRPRTQASSRRAGRRTRGRSVRGRRRRRSRSGRRG